MRQQARCQPLTRLFNLLAGCRANKRVDYSRCLVGGSSLDRFLGEFLNQSELFSNHIGQRGAKGHGLFSDQLLEARRDQGTGDVGQAALDEGFEKGYLLFQPGCQPFFHERGAGLCADCRFHGFGHKGC